MPCRFPLPRFKAPTKGIGMNRKMSRGAWRLDLHPVTKKALRQPAKWELYREALAIYGLTKNTLRRWMRDKGGCPYLGGKNIRFEILPLRVRGNQWRWALFLWKPDLDKIKAERAAQRKARELTTAQVAERLGISTAAVKQLRRTAKKEMGRLTTVSVDRRPRPGYVFTQAELKCLKQRLAARKQLEPWTDPQGRSWLPGKLAEESYPNATRHVRATFRNKSCPYLGGDVLHAVPRRMGQAKRGRWPSEWYFLEDDLARLAEPKVGPRSESPDVRSTPNACGRVRPHAASASS
jgi:hypothetical protein